MKKVFLFLSILIITIHSKAQDSTQSYKPFKVIASMGGTISFGAPPIPGISFSLEPNYTLSDKLDVGLLFRTLTVPVRYDDIIEQEDAVSIHALADFYPVSNKVKPFVGAGFGYNLMDYSNTAHSNKLITPDNFSILTRVGLRYKHLNIAIEHYYLKTRWYNNYMEVKVGVAIGGGRKK